MHHSDILAAQSTDALSDILEEFCKDTALPLMSADELLLEVWRMIDDERDDLTRAQLRRHISWLSTFINQWELVQKEEDFRTACVVRGEW